MKKKILSLVLAAAMTMSLGAGFSAGAVAVEPALNASAMSVSELAYMDLKAAPASLQDDIREARNDIIFGGQAWTVDGAVSIQHRDGTVEELKDFYELFPADWEVPTDAELAQRLAQITIIPYAGTVDWHGTIELPFANNWTNSREFYTFVGTGSYVYAYAVTAPPNSTYNIGFSRGGSNVGWCPYLVASQSGARIRTGTNDIYGVRGSVNAGAEGGWHSMKVSSTPGPNMTWVEV